MVVRIRREGNGTRGAIKAHAAIGGTADAGDENRTAVLGHEMTQGKHLGLIFIGYPCVVGITIKSKQSGSIPNCALIIFKGDSVYALRVNKKT